MDTPVIKDEVVTPTSSQATGEWEKASVMKRFIAVILDALVLLPVTLVFNWIASTSEALGMIQFLGSFASIIYSVYFLSTTGATLGKKWMGIRVVKTNGQNLTIGDALLREVVGKFVSGIVLGLGYFWAIWDKNKQAWHDKIANTYVVTKSS